MYILGLIFWHISSSKTGCFGVVSWHVILGLTGDRWCRVGILGAAGLVYFEFSVSLFVVRWRSHVWLVLEPRARRAISARSHEMSVFEGLDSFLREIF